MLVYNTAMFKRWLTVVILGVMCALPVFTLVPAAVPAAQARRHLHPPHHRLARPPAPSITTLSLRGLDYLSRNIRHR